MSTPIKADDTAPLDALQSALGEILSAESALNMHPDPMSAEMQAQKGEAGEIYNRWLKELKPQGFGLSARIVSYDDGIIGDIALYLTWSE